MATKLTLIEELELGKKMAEGDVYSRELLITNNINLVYSIAKQFMNCGLDLDDLVGYGMIGLVNSVDKYDYKLGLKLSTSATNWIRQSITRGLQDNTRTIRLPEYIINELTRVNKIKSELTSKLNRQPTITELSKATGVEVKDLIELLQTTLNTTSLSTTVYEDDNETTLEDICSSGDETPTDYVNRIETNSKVEKLLNKLDSKTRIVVEMRFGLNGYEESSLEEIGQVVGMSKMGVKKLLDRQLESWKNN